MSYGYLPSYGGRCQPIWQHLMHSRTLQDVLSGKRMYHGDKPGAIVLHADLYWCPFAFMLHPRKRVISYCCVKPAEFQGVIHLSKAFCTAMGECNFIVSMDAVIAIRNASTGVCKVTSYMDQITMLPSAANTDNAVDLPPMHTYAQLQPHSPW